ncbi:MAG: DEAD/DEAH box helicase family protein [Muribaculaceae bacterium]|nr:DEAD/DEAH box helicase family protein [Muribaculaceae bacterium]
MELKDYQRRAVNELKGKLIELLNQNEDRQKLVFKAPTGSGKTVMASALLDELTRDLPVTGECVFTRVAWVWIAPNKLHQQSYRSMKNYFSETRSLHPVMFDECDHLEGLMPGDVLFLNWESVNKDNAVIIRDNEQNRTLYELLRRTRLQQNTPIVVIIDEEHMFGGRNAVKSEKLLENIKPKVEVRISATPVTQSYHAVTVVRRNDVIAEEMIKKGVQLNPNLRFPKDDLELTVNQRLLVQALKKRQELAKLYTQYGINPLLLIQLPNDSSESISTSERRIVNEIKAYLATCDITIENGRLAVWLSEDKSPNLDMITRRDDICQVLLFKQAIALGWDCPRAAVLLIFREIKSVTFTTQTVGRILRMPEQRFYQDERLNYGYVYTNLSADIINIVSDDMNYISTIYANRRKDLNNVTLDSYYLDRHGPQRNRLGAEFRRIFAETMREAWEQDQMLLFDNEDSYFEDDPGSLFHEPDKEAIESMIMRNRNNARKHGIQTDVSRIFVTIPKDTPLTGENGIVEITDKAKVALNASELNMLFTMFCRRNVGSFSKFDSTPVLRGAIENALENYLQIFATDVPRIVLYHRNRPHFEDLIRAALNRYAELLKGKGAAATATYQKQSWQVPATRIYNSASVENLDSVIFNHAMEPFFQATNASQPERDFAQWLDRQREVVDWWYKNGDDGKQHFAIPYTDIYGVKRCFFVDFIIRLKSGNICLFDTKTKGSDENGAVKNNALYEYIKTYREAGQQMVGGLLICDSENWYYPEGLIEDTYNLTGWKKLELNNI